MINTMIFVYVHPVWSSTVAEFWTESSVEPTPSTKHIQEVELLQHGSTDRYPYIGNHKP